MPIIDVSIAEGRSQEELRAFADALHSAAASTVGAKPENTTVLIRQVPKTQWSRGNVTIAEREAGA